MLWHDNGLTIDLVSMLLAKHFLMQPASCHVTYVVASLLCVIWGQPPAESTQTSYVAQATATVGK